MPAVGKYQRNSAASTSFLATNENVMAFIRNLAEVMRKIPHEKHTQGKNVSVVVSVVVGDQPPLPLVTTEWARRALMASDSWMKMALIRAKSKLHPPVYKRVRVSPRVLQRVRLLTIDDLKILKGMMIYGPGKALMVERGEIYDWQPLRDDEILRKRGRRRKGSPTPTPGREGRQGPSRLVQQGVQGTPTPKGVGTPE